MVKWVYLVPLQTVRHHDLGPLYLVTNEGGKGMEGSRFLAYMTPTMKGGPLLQQREGGTGVLDNQD